MARLDPQVQLEVAVAPVDALMAPFEALDVAQVQKAQPRAPVALVVRQSYQPVGDEGRSLRPTSPCTGSRSG